MPGILADGVRGAYFIAMTTGADQTDQWVVTHPSFRQRGSAMEARTISGWFTHNAAATHAPRGITTTSTRKRSFWSDWDMCTC